MVAFPVPPSANINYGLDAAANEQQRNLLMQDILFTAAVLLFIGIVTFELRDCSQYNFDNYFIASTLEPVKSARGIEVQTIRAAATL